MTESGLDHKAKGAEAETPRRGRGCALAGAGSSCAAAAAPSSQCFWTLETRSSGPAQLRGRLGVGT